MGSISDELVKSALFNTSQFLQLTRQTTVLRVAWQPEQPTVSFFSVVEILQYSSGIVSCMAKGKSWSIPGPYRTCVDVVCVATMGKYCIPCLVPHHQVLEVEREVCICGHTGRGTWQASGQQPCTCLAAPAGHSKITPAGHSKITPAGHSKITPGIWLGTCAQQGTRCAGSHSHGLVLLVAPLLTLLPSCQ
jgi:hypothetical protein